MKKRKILLDCDPGHDDAIAIMLAGRHPGLELMGITVEAGNQTLEKTGRNALNVVQYLDLDVEVALGSSRPLVRELQIAEDIHGESGLDGFEFPDLERDFSDKHAVTFLIDILRQSEEKITIVTTGPMTNVALAMRLEPKIIENIEEVVLMGGSYGYGNVSPAAEFNILVDPEAAHIVFTSGLKVSMMGLDVTRKVLALPSVVKRMEAIGNKASRMFADLMNAFNENQRKVYGFEGGPLHDPVTIAYLVAPDMLTMKHVHCDIDLSHGVSYGRTNCDVFDYLKQEKNAYVATDIDAERFWELIEQGLKRYDDLE